MFRGELLDELRLRAREVHAGGTGYAEPLSLRRFIECAVGSTLGDLALIAEDDDEYTHDLAEWQVACAVAKAALEHATSPR